MKKYQDFRHDVRNIAKRHATDLTSLARAITFSNISRRTSPSLLHIQARPYSAASLPPPNLDSGEQVIYHKLTKRFKPSELLVFHHLLSTTSSFVQHGGGRYNVNDPPKGRCCSQISQCCTTTTDVFVGLNICRTHHLIIACMSRRAREAALFMEVSFL